MLKLSNMAQGRKVLLLSFLIGVAYNDVNGGLPSDPFSMKLPLSEEVLYELEEKRSRIILCGPTNRQQSLCGVGLNCKLLALESISRGHHIS